MMGLAKVLCVPDPFLVILGSAPPIFIDKIKMSFSLTLVTFRARRKEQHPLDQQDLSGKRS